MKKKALMRTNKGLGFMITKAIRTLGSGKGHSVQMEIKLMQDSIGKIDELLPKVVHPGMRARMTAKRNELQGKLDGRLNYSTRLAAEHNKAKQTAGTVAGVGGAMGIAGGGAYMIDKANEPDMGDYKLAEDWVSGFITKCAAYNIDGQAWLDKLLDEVEKTGTVKNAQWGRLLGGLLGGGALYGGANLLRRSQVAERQGAVAAKAKALQLNKEREADLKKMMDEEQGSFQYQPTAQAIEEVNRLRAPITPAANPPAGLPTNDASRVPPVKKPLPAATVAPVKPLRRQV